MHLRHGAGAGLLAASAGGGADAAMLMHAGMPGAFLTADAAGLGAGLQGQPDHIGIGAGPPRGHRSGSGADIGTIEIKPDTLDQIPDHILSQACIGAGRARLGAVIAFLDAAQQRIRYVRVDLGMGADHFTNVHGLPLSLSWKNCNWGKPGTRANVPGRLCCSEHEHLPNPDAPL